MKRRPDPHQLTIDWTTPAPVTRGEKGSPPKDEEHGGTTVATAANPLRTPSPPPLVQILPWDFSTTYPQPTNEAIEAGVIMEAAEKKRENLLHFFCKCWQFPRNISTIRMQ